MYVCVRVCVHVSMYVHGCVRKMFIIKEKKKRGKRKEREREEKRNEEKTKTYSYR